MRWLCLALLVAFPSFSSAQEADAGPEDAGLDDASTDAAVEDAEAEAEDAEPAPAPEPDEAEGVPPAEIGRRIEETFHELQLLTPLLRRQSATQGIERAMPNFVDYVTRLSDDPALRHLDSLHSASLHDLEHEWSRVRLRLTGWQDSLETRTASLTDAREATVEMQQLWTATRESNKEVLPESQLERVDALLARIAIVLRRIDRRLEGVLGLQGQLSDEGIRIARQASRIQAAQQNVRDRRQRRDHRPVWRGWGRLGDADEDAPSQAVVAEEHFTAVRAFAYTEKKPLLVHGTAFLVLALVFLFLRIRTSARLKPGGRPSAHRALRAQPIASALLLVYILAPIIYHYVPVFLIGASLVLLVPIVHVLNRHMLPAAHRPILAMIILSALSVPLSLGFAPEWSRRYYTLVLALLGLKFVLELWSPKLRQVLTSTDRERRRLYGLLRLALVPLGYAIYLLFAGYTERAELWTTGTLWVFEQAVGIFVGTELLTALAILSLRHPAARMLYMVRNHRRKVAHYVDVVLHAAAVVALLLLALRSFDLLDPTLESSRAAFRRTFEFGSIELSFGSVVAFVAMLIGTFLVMRIVHVLLEYEILPRFRLEQGISSAISLSASYLLVAIGVVLAFGVAGVGPERLALLGGALGVGIGFGLQNVVSNFVSGLILVAERPIQVGDVIEVDGDLVGRVQRIGIRSSSVHSLDGAEVIVPNADLVSGKLINWTLSDARRRFDLVIGAGYAHDPAEVMRLLNQVVRRQPRILHDPAPEVFCTSFADSAIEYTVRAWAGGYLEAIEAKSSLAAAVYATFAEHEIEIPFPQQDVHIKSTPDGKTNV
ncbi:MAG: mechanosensitive ion channel domain-containing protein [Myxococcota bacterium]